MNIITGKITDFEGNIENVGNLSIGTLSQIHEESELSVREEIKTGFSHILAAEHKLQEIETEMNQKPEDMEVIERYTSALEHFSNIG